MAGTLLIGPTGRNPDYARGEAQYARMVGADSYVIVSAGGGMIHTVNVGVAGVLAKFYDVKSGGTTDNTTEILTVDISAPTTAPFTLPDVAFSQGLTVIVTGGSADIMVSFRGALTVSPRTFGTQLDGNAGRATGTSTDKWVPDR